MFYEINSSPQIHFYGPDNYFLTITKKYLEENYSWKFLNDDSTIIESNKFDLYGMIVPNILKFNSYGEFLLTNIIEKQVNPLNPSIVEYYFEFENTFQSINNFTEIKFLENSEINYYSIQKDDIIKESYLFFENYETPPLTMQEFVEIIVLDTYMYNNKIYAKIGFVDKDGNISETIDLTTTNNLLTSGITNIKDIYLTFGSWVPNDEILNDWEINDRNISDIFNVYEKISNNKILLNTITIPTIKKVAFPNLLSGDLSKFDLTSNEYILENDNLNTGSIIRKSANNSFFYIFSNEEEPNNNESISFKITYKGNTNSALTLKILLFVRFKDQSDNYYPNFVPSWAYIRNLFLLTKDTNTEENFNVNSSKLFGLNSQIFANNIQINLANNNFKDFIHINNSTPFLFAEEISFLGNKLHSNIVPIENKNTEDLFLENISKPLLRTNPALGGNIKICIDSNNEIYLDTLEANDTLSQSRYKKYKIDKSGNYAKDLHKFLKGTPKDKIFDVYYENKNFYVTKRYLENKYENFYFSGPSYLNSKYYKEKYSYFAPIWLGEKIPQYFIIFKIKQKKIFESTKEKFIELLNNSTIVKTWNLQNSNIGEYIKNIQKSIKENSILEINFDKYTPQYFGGIHIDSGTYTKIAELLYVYYKNDTSVLEFEKTITEGFKRNGLIVPNLLNLEFLFDDENNTDFENFSYIGLYVDTNNIDEFFLDIEKIKYYNNLELNEIYENSYIINNNIIVNNNNYFYKILEKKYFESHNPKLSNIIEDKIFYLKNKDNFYSIKNLDSEKFLLRENNINLKDLFTDKEITLQSKFIKKEGNSVLDIFINNFWQKIDGKNCFDENEELIIVDKRFVEDTEKNYLFFVNNVDLLLNKYHFTTFYIENDTLYYRLNPGFTQPSVGSIITISNLVWNNKKFNLEETIEITNSGLYKIINFVEDPINNEISYDLKLVYSYVPAGTPVPADNIIIENSISKKEDYADITINNYRIDNNLIIKFPTILGNFDSYKISYLYEKINIQKLHNSYTDIEIDYIFNNFFNKWKIIANSQGLQSGDWHNFPVYDSEQKCFVNMFSPEGTLEEVTKAIVGAFNSFKDTPFNAKFIKPGHIKIISNIESKENFLEFVRKVDVTTQYNKIYSNTLRFFAPNLLKNLHKFENLEHIFAEKPSILNCQMLINNDRCVYIENKTKWYIIISKSTGWTNIVIRKYCNDTNYTNISTSGILFSFLIPSTQPKFVNYQFPFIIDLNKFQNGIYEFAFISEYIEQKIDFLGGYFNTYYLEEPQQLFNNKFEKIKIIQKINDFTYKYESNKKLNLYNYLIFEKPIEYFNETIFYYDGNLQLGEIEIFEPHNIRYQTPTEFFAQINKNQYDHIKFYKLFDCFVGPLEIDEKYFVSLESKKEIIFNTENRFITYKLSSNNIGIFSFYGIYDFDYNIFKTDWSNSPEHIENEKIYKIELLEKEKWYELDINSEYLLNIEKEIDISNITTIEPYILIKTEFLWNGNWYKGPQLNILEYNITNSISQNIIKNENFRLNTYLPTFLWDMLEMPKPIFSPNTHHYFTPGKGNYMLRNLRNSNGKIIIPEKLRIKFETSAEITFLGKLQKNLLNNEYKTFKGFSKLELNSEKNISLLENEQFLEFFEQNNLDSEYLYLNEPFLENLAYESKNIPYIVKWGYKNSTDVRGNKYRLNVHPQQFGLLNFSPAINVAYRDPKFFSQEIFLLNKPLWFSEIHLLDKKIRYTPKDILEKTTNGKTWYQNFIEGNEDKDWFTLFFTSNDYFKNNIWTPTNTKQYFNFLNKSYENTYETIYNGIKYKFFGNYEGYKFANIMFLDYTYDFTNYKPFEIKYLENKKYKWILIICKLNINDSRLRKFFSYLSLYSLIDNISLQEQIQSEYKSKNVLGTDYEYISEMILPKIFVNDIENYIFPYCYTNLTIDSNNIAYIKEHKNYFTNKLDLIDIDLKNDFKNPYKNLYKSQKYRQGIFGNSYARINDVPLYSDLDINLNETQNNIDIIFNNISEDINYSPGTNFNINLPIEQEYFYNKNIFSKFYYWDKNFNIFTQPGTPFYTYFNSIEIINNPNKVDIWNFDKVLHNYYLPGIIQINKFNNFVRNEQYYFDTNEIKLLPDKIKINLPNIKKYFNKINFFTNKSSNIISNVNSIVNSNFLSLPLIPSNTEILKENWILYGGKNYLQNIFNELNFIKIKEILSKFNIGIEVPQLIEKNNLKIAMPLKEKPAEYFNEEIIGYYLEDTNLDTKIFRYNGKYEPVFFNLINFSNIDKNMLDLIDFDFALRNTNILSWNNIDVFFNKISETEILKLKNEKWLPKYPYIEESSIYREEFDIFSDIFTKNFFTYFYDLNKFNFKNTYDYISGSYGNKIIKTPFSSLTTTPENIILQNLEPKIFLEQFEDKQILNININLLKEFTKEIIDKIKNNFIFIKNYLEPENFENWCAQYIEKNIFNIFEIKTISLYSKNQIGENIFYQNLFETQNNFEKDKNFNYSYSNITKELNIIKDLDTKNLRTFSLQIILQRI